MSSNDRALSMIVALGLTLAACGGEPQASLEGLGSEGLGSAELGNAALRGDQGAPGAEELVEKGTTGVLSGVPSFFDFGVAGFGESPSIQWVISSSQRSELVVALDVEPFNVDPIGCAVIEPSDPSLRRCVLTVTFNVPGEAGTYAATLSATDIDGNATSLSVVGVGEGVVF